MAWKLRLDLLANQKLYVVNLWRGLSVSCADAGGLVLLTAVKVK